MGMQKSKCSQRKTSQQKRASQDEENSLQNTKRACKTAQTVIQATPLADDLGPQHDDPGINNVENDLRSSRRTARIAPVDAWEDLPEAVEVVAWEDEPPAEAAAAAFDGESSHEYGFPFPSWLETFKALADLEDEPRPSLAPELKESLQLMDEILNTTFLRALVEDKIPKAHAGNVDGEQKQLEGGRHCWKGKQKLFKDDEPMTEGRLDDGDGAESSRSGEERNHAGMKDELIDEAGMRGGKKIEVKSKARGGFDVDLESMHIIVDNRSYSLAELKRSLFPEEDESKECDQLYNGDKKADQPESKECDQQCNGDQTNQSDQQNSKQSEQQSNGEKTNQSDL